jgi:predicted nucleic acid-binding protein
MAYLVDTNVLLRWVQPGDPMNPVAEQAVEELVQQGETVYISPQNCVEFWSVATRPVAVNGLGRSPAGADAELQRIEQFFPLLPDLPTIHAEWRQLVVRAGVSGVKAHDARLVAVMRAHGLTHLLTFNAPDFQRFTGITVVHPQDVVPPPAPPTAEPAADGST